LTTVGQFLSQAQPIVATIPGALPYMIEMIKWVAAGMRGSNEIQGILDQAINALRQNPPQGEQKPQDNSVQVAQINNQGKTQQIQLKGQIDAKLKQTDRDLELRNDMLLGREGSAQEGQLVLQEGQADAMLENIQAQNRKGEILMEGALDMRKTAQERAHDAQSADSERRHEAAMTERTHLHESRMAEKGNQYAIQQVKAKPAPKAGK